MYDFNINNPQNVYFIGIGGISMSGLAELLLHRNELYQAQLHRIQQYEKEKRLLILAPKSIYGMKTLTKDKKALHQLYLDAWKDAEAIPLFLKSGFC